MQLHHFRITRFQTGCEFQSLWLSKKGERRDGEEGGKGWGGGRERRAGKDKGKVGERRECEKKEGEEENRREEQGEKIHIRTEKEMSGEGNENK